MTNEFYPWAGNSAEDRAISRIDTRRRIRTDRRVAAKVRAVVVGLSLVPTSQPQTRPV